MATNTRKRYKEIDGLIREVVGTLPRYASFSQIDERNFALDLVYVFIKDGNHQLREALFATIYNRYEKPFKNALWRYCEYHGIVLKNSWWMYTGAIPF